ncbi:MAG: hypothetical protein OXG23_00770 [Chloroflexi bacterium]|nr:hypothetical protein [Chloroflexota bacterium]MCY3976604.1 hypothetical protein [Chloroflexota bacterium]
MADGSTAESQSQMGEAQPPNADAAKAYQEARERFSARRDYKRALRRARNPLYFSLRSLALLLFLVLLASALTLALVFALRREPETAELAPVFEVVEERNDRDDVIQVEEPKATTVPDVEIIMAAETPENMVLEGPAIPTVIITNTPIPLRVAVQAAIYGVGSDKLNIRNRPSLTGSEVLFRESEGKIFDVIGGPQEADGFTWWRVRDPQFQVEGWAVANYLRTVAE